jgi:hypothetical protein
MNVGTMHCGFRIADCGMNTGNLSLSVLSAFSASDLILSAFIRENPRPKKLCVLAVIPQSAIRIPKSSFFSS